MTVYLLVHDDRMYDMGDMVVRGVYATRELAEQNRIDRTPSGRPSQAYDAHTDDCCYVEEREVEGP